MIPSDLPFKVHSIICVKIYHTGCQRSEVTSLCFRSTTSQQKYLEKCAFRLKNNSIILLGSCGLFLDESVEVAFLFFELHHFLLHQLDLLPLGDQVSHHLAALLLQHVDPPLEFVESRVLVHLNITANSLLSAIKIKLADQTEKSSRIDLLLSDEESYDGSLQLRVSFLRD